TRRMDGELPAWLRSRGQGRGAATHRSESAGEKAAPTAGRVRAGAAGHDERARYNLPQRYAEGMSLNAAAYIGRMLQPRDAIGPAVGNGGDARPRSDRNGGNLHRDVCSGRDRQGCRLSYGSRRRGVAWVGVPLTVGTILIGLLLL